MQCRAEGKANSSHSGVKWLNHCVKMESTRQMVLEMEGAGFAVTGEIRRFLSACCVDISAVTNRDVSYETPPSVLHSIRP